MHQLVSKFLRQSARLCVTADSYEERLDVAPRAIFIEGNEEGFRSLAEIIALYLNELEDVLLVSDLSFVTKDMPKSFAMRFSYGDQVGEVTQGSVAEAADQFEWTLTETEAAVVATSLHGIGYAFEHLHFDPAPGASEYAVYCGRLK
jgi:hypothetical protein